MTNTFDEIIRAGVERFYALQGYEFAHTKGQPFFILEIPGEKSRQFCMMLASAITAESVKARIEEVRKRRVS